MAALPVGAASLVFATVMLTAASQGRGYDLAPLPVAGRLVATGNAAHVYAQHPGAYNLVADPVFREAAVELGFTHEPTPFVYPPLIAVLMEPAAGIPFAVLMDMWAALSTVCVLFGVYLTLAVYMPTYLQPRPAALVLIALCAFEPLLYGFWLSQTTAVMFPLIVGAILLQRRGRPAAAGLALAFAAFIKITPAVLAAVWLWRGPRRAVWTFVAALVGLWAVSVALLGIDVHEAYVQRLAAIGQTTVVAFNNHSLLAFVSRFSFDGAARLDWQMHPPLPWAVAASTTLAACGAVAGAGILSRIRRESEQAWRPLAEGFALIAMLLIPNIAWTHYFVFLLPIAAMVFAWRPAIGHGPAAVATAACLLCMRPILPPQHVLPSAAANVWRMSAPTLAAGLLAIALFWIAWRERPGTEDSRSAGDKT
jgi:alpha-1,2-mannosyltransferase